MTVASSNQPIERAAMPCDDFALLDAIAQAELVRRREVAPIELVDAAIARIERLNPGLNAVVTPLYDEARRTARVSAGPFSGVPFLLKDSLASYAGARMTSGSRLLRSHIAGHDSELVIRLRRAGLIVLGKTNCAEFGLLPTTEPQLFGATRNPWDTQRTPGGSSGGSAAAVAAGMVPMAHGSDGGGSIRIPASCCGVFGLKPTRARNPIGPDQCDVHSRLVVEHALTRSVRDSAALLDATSLPGLGDSCCAPPPQRPFLQEVDADPGRLRIAFSEKTLAPVHRDCVRALDDAATLCRELGHEVTETNPPIDYQLAAQSFTTLWAAGCAATIDGLSRRDGKSIGADDVEPLTWALYEMGRRVSASAYQLAIVELQVMSRNITRLFTECDVWLTPVLAEPPPVLGSFDAPADDPLAALRRAWAFAPITGICNFTGQPAMSVPLYWTTEGIPIGSHFAGRFGDEATLFRLAGQLERCRPWAGRWPSTWVPRRVA